MTTWQIIACSILGLIVFFGIVVPIFQFDGDYWETAGVLTAVFGAVALIVGLLLIAFGEWVPF